MSRDCTFNALWLVDERYRSWLVRDKIKPGSSARCSVCLKTFDIRSMGEAALKSHMNGKKHQNLMPKSKASSAVPEETSSSNLKGDAIDSSATATKDTSLHIAKTDVLSAEILWTLKMCTSHYSQKSSEESGALFHRMFPDSAIAARFKCGETKSSYLINHGIAPYFKSLLLEKLRSESLEFVLLFDESLNSKTQSKQMDVHVRFWDGGEVRTRYYHSEFMGHATAINMVSVFDTATSDLHMQNMLQLSMDGPNVNWKFHDLIDSRLQKDYNKSLLNTGSCGLHIVHGAFKHGVEATGWNTDEFLNSVYWLLKDTPARREDYAGVVGGEALMPLRFCRTRWTENVPVVERAAEMLPQLRLYVKAVQESKVPHPKTKSYEIVKESCSDPLIEAKLSFYRSVGKEIQPFLTLYQTDKPMMPFLCSDLYDLLKSLMNRVMKFDVMVTNNSAIKLCEVKVNDRDNHQPYKKVDIGFTADKILKKLVNEKKISERQEMEFRQEAKSFIIAILSKLLNKCPLQYSLVRNMSCLDARQMSCIHV